MDCEWGTVGCDYRTWNLNRGPCNVIMGQRNVIMGTWNVNRVPSNVILGRWNENRVPWNVNRGLGI